jgi:hypothetical protein
MEGSAMTAYGVLLVLVAKVGLALAWFMAMLSYGLWLMHFGLPPIGGEPGEKE